MLTLYAIAPSLYCAKTRIALRHKGTTWREVPPPGGYGSAEYRTVIASGNLPALVDDALTLADSEAIAEYLDEAYPEPPLLPGHVAERARTRELSRFHDTRLEPELRRLFVAIRPDRRDGALIDRQQAALNARLAQLAVMLADRPEAGRVQTLADTGFPITFAWLDALAPRLGCVIDWAGPVRAYRARIEALPAVAAELAAYRPALEAFLAGEGA